MRAIIGHNLIDFIEMIGVVSYAYDDIGNRITAEGKTYTANNLNQYTKIADFTPEYDADGNQTLIQTSTGIWRVAYDAENRPILWQSGDTVITMAFDRMGRRVEMRTATSTSDLLQRFVYKDFLCIQQLRGPDNTPYQTYVWDPTEPIATRPLLLRDASGSPFYYFHDANKNVAGLTDASATQSLHYAYSPYGTSSLLPSSTLSLDNSFQFSSEYHDTSLALTYYNYRHYNYEQGRWMSRDPIEVGPVCYVFRNPILNRDYLGLSEDAACANFCSSKEAEELWLRAFEWNQEEGTMAVPMGLTLCCKGKVQVCDFTDKAISAGLSVEGVNLAEKTVRDAISFCTLKHEIYHASEAKCDKCETGFAQPRAAAKSRPDLPGGALFDECAAYTTEINCLINRRKYDCTTMSCRKSLTNFIENKRKQRAKACSPEYIDPRDLEEDLERKYQLME